MPASSSNQDAARRRPVPPIFEGIGRRVRELRSLLDLTQDDLAEVAGLARTSIANLEGGRQAVPLAVLVAIADALGVTVAILLGESPMPPQITLLRRIVVSCETCGPIDPPVDSTEAAAAARRAHLLTHTRRRRAARQAVSDAG